MPWVNKTKCLGCKACVSICPVGAISMVEGKAVINQSQCIHCGKCLTICPQEAIRPNSENPSLKGRGVNGRGGMHGHQNL